MKIFGNVPGVTPVYSNKSKAVNAYAAAEAAPKRDELTISSQAKDFAAVMKQLKAIPDVRADRVSALAEPVSQGTYSVSSAAISEKIIASLSAKRI